MIAKKDLNNTVSSLVQNSIPFAIVNVIGTKKEEVKFLDKKTGKAASFFYFAHKATTTGEEADLLIIKDPVPRGEDGEKATRPSYKGKQFLVILSDMERNLQTGITILGAKEMQEIGN